MKPLFRNLFLLFGIGAIVVMLCTFDVDWNALRNRLPQAIAYLPLVVGVWIFVYAFNAVAFQLIVNSGRHDKHLRFRHAYKLTVSGFAFSYTTPFGFGGGPYRVMELAAHIGTTRAMSSVVLYSMMHILSHICLWTSAAVLFVVFYFDKMDGFLWACGGVFVAVLAFALYFFYKGYKNGLIVKLYKILLYIPFVKGYARKFYDKNMESMAQIDENIAYLHTQPRAFYGSVLMEYLGRVVNSFEFYFILMAFGTPVSFVDAVLILAFSSLLGNLLFFFPMQMGAREGGLAIIIKVLGYRDGLGLGVFTGFFTRIRELIWIFIGVALVKVGNKNLVHDRKPPVSHSGE